MADRNLTRKQLRQKVAGGMLERAQGRAKRLGVNLEGPVTRGRARELRTQLRERREGGPRTVPIEGPRATPRGTVPGVKPSDLGGKAAGGGKGAGVKDQVSQALVERTRARQKRLGLPAAGPVTKKAAKLALTQMREARGVTVGPGGKKTYKDTQPQARAEKLTSLGFGGKNVITEGPGAERTGQKYKVGWDPLKRRYVHVYGEGTEEEQRKYIRQANPWTSLYGKPQRARERIEAGRKKGKKTSPIGVPT